MGTVTPTIGQEPYEISLFANRDVALSYFFLQNGRMFVLWQTPTCVSSQDDRSYPFMEPWAYDGPFERSMSRLRNYLEFNGAKVSFFPQECPDPRMLLLVRMLRHYLQVLDRVFACVCINQTMPV